MKRGKKLLSLLLTLMLCLSLFPRAQAQESEGTIAPVESGAIAPVPVETQESGSDSYCGDDLTWSLDENGTLTISGTGDMWDWTMDESAWPSTPWQTTVSRITRIRIEPGVTGIGNAAFYGCQNVTDISIADTVKRIGSEAFFLCRGLLSLTIPEGVTSIGDSAFCNCFSLESVTIPASVTSIGEIAFAGCSSLMSIDVASDNAGYSSADGVLFNKDMSAILMYPGGKSGDYSIPESVTEIGEGAFARCGNLTNVAIPSGVNEIGDTAFYMCRSLTSVTIPSGVTSIGTATFVWCSSLRSITIPAAVNYIGNAAFDHCGLQEICFRGAAPVFASDESDGRQYQFGGVTATAYYPAGDPSWTESLRQDYCGSITWVAYEPGDMNDDAEVDSLDLMLLRKQLVGLPAEGTFNPAAADLNGDGTVDILDLVRLRKFLA